MATAIFATRSEAARFVSARYSEQDEATQSALGEWVWQSQGIYASARELAADLDAALGHEVAADGGSIAEALESVSYQLAA